MINSKCNIIVDVHLVTAFWQFHWKVWLDWKELWPIPPDRTGETESDFHIIYTHTFSALPTNLTGFKPLCNLFGSMLTVIVHFENQFVPRLELPVWCLKMLLQYLHILFSPHDAIYLVKCTSPPLQLKYPHNTMLPPHFHTWDYTISTLFLLNVSMVFIAERFNFLSSKMKVFVPVCICKLQSGLMLFLE